MRDLRLIGVHEDGQRLLLSDSGGERYAVPLDDPLRAAVRRDRPRLGQLQIEIDGGMRPREVQALIRAGRSAEEAAERSGWTVEKVRRYEGPILAEREYVAGLAKAVRLRGRTSAGASSPTLAARVSQRLSGRGVDPATAEWDSARGDAGDWTVIVTFPAGGRERQARWFFDVPARTVSAADDEARWLSEEDATAAQSPLPAPHLVSTPVRATTVYDVEAEGGVQAGARRTTPRATPRATPADEPLDLMTAMRERASHRGRPRRQKSPAAGTPLDASPREDALPLEDLAYDPETMPPPPAARGPHPLDDASAPTGVESTTDESTTDESTTVESTTVEPTEPAAPEVDEVDPAPSAAASATADGIDDVGEDVGEDVGGDVLPAAGDLDDDDLDFRPVARRPARKPARKSVPSWDDVMFGAKPRD